MGIILTKPDINIVSLWRLPLDILLPLRIPSMDNIASRSREWRWFLTDSNSLAAKELAITNVGGEG